MTNPTPQQQADHIEEKKELEREAMRLHKQEMYKIPPIKQLKEKT